MFLLQLSRVSCHVKFQTRASLEQGARQAAQPLQEHHQAQRVQQLLLPQHLQQLLAAPIPLTLTIAAVVVVVLVMVVVEVVLATIRHMTYVGNLHLITMLPVRAAQPLPLSQLPLITLHQCSLLVKDLGGHVQSQMKVCMTVLIQYL